MREALQTDKKLVVSILSSAFDDNKSVNFIVKQDVRRTQRIRQLMQYSFDVCQRFGKVYLSADEKACALVLYPHKKKISWYAAWLDLTLALYTIGISRIAGVLKRERAVKQHHPQKPFTYLWFIGVEPPFAGKGIGSELLKEVLLESSKLNLPVYLETSVEKNFAWYAKWGFEKYHELLVPYRLAFYRLG